MRRERVGQLGEWQKRRALHSRQREADSTQWPQKGQGEGGRNEQSSGSLRSML